MNALVYVDIDWGIHKGKLINALNEERKKLHGFSFPINMTNFEAFCRTKKLISNLFFLNSDLLGISRNAYHKIIQSQKDQELMKHFSKSLSSKDKK